MTRIPITPAAVKTAVARARRAQTDLQWVEIKAASRKLPSETVNTLSAFSNTSGGLLILGLAEDGGFKPVKDFAAKNIQDALIQACNEKMQPPVMAEIQIMEFESSNIVAAYIPEIPPNTKPCYIKEHGEYHGSFRRTGDGDILMSGYEIDRVLEEKHQPNYDTEVVPDSTLEDLNSELVGGLLARERKNTPRVFGKLGDEDALQSLRVLAKASDGKLHPTIAGLLALGDYPQQFFPRLNVTFTYYPGTTKADNLQDNRRYLDSATLVGPIPMMISDTLQVIRKNMRTGSVIEGAFRTDIPDYPEVAIREAVANALMHRDYSPEGRGAQVQVNMYADRLEILNPGGLYGPVTVDQLGEFGMSSTRNAFLSNILESTPYLDGSEFKFVVENKGTGYATIEKSLADALMDPPIPKDNPGYFSLTFRKRHLLAGERRNLPADEVKAAILSMLSRQESIRTKDIIDASGLSRPTVLRYLKELMAEGSVEQTEPGRNPKQRYRLAGHDKL